MAKFPKDAAIIKEGMKDLYLICLNAEKQKRIGAFKGGCKALISALQVGPSSFSPLLRLAPDPESVLCRSTGRMHR